MTSARGNGRAITARLEKCPICASLDRKKVNRRCLLKILGMPDLQCHELLGGNDEGVKLISELSRERQSESRGPKRSFPEIAVASSLLQDSGQEEPEDGLKMWGYMPGHVHYNLSLADGDVSRESSILLFHLLYSRIRGKINRPASRTRGTMLRKCCMQYLHGPSRVNQPPSPK